MSTIVKTRSHISPERGSTHESQALARTCRVAIASRSRGGIESGYDSRTWIQEGIEKGELIGRIRTLQEVLGHKVGAREELGQLAREELERIVAKLNAAPHDRN